MSFKKRVPTHDPQTGELNPYYEELTGENNPLESKHDLLMEMPVPYEPKKKNRWVLMLGDGKEIKPWVLYKASRPRFKKINSFWKGTYYEIQEMEFVLNDPIEPSVSKYLYSLIKGKKKLDMTLEMLDPTGVVVEKWTILDCDVIEVDFGGLDYSDDGLVICRIKVKPNSAELLY